MKNLSIIEEEDRFWEWYQGYSLLYLPYHDLRNGNRYTYKIKSYSSSSLYQVLYFGNSFDPEQVPMKDFILNSSKQLCLDHQKN